MAIAIRGGSPATSSTTTATVSVTLTGTRQPQSGDVLCIIHCNDFYTLGAMTTPTVGGSTSGVTAITGTGLPADGGTDFAHAKPYYYVVGSTGDLTVSETETGAGDEEKGLAVFVLSGVDNGTPIDVAVGAFDSSNTSTTAHICPSVSPSSSDAFLICHVNDGGGADSGPVTAYPSGMTSAYDVDAGGMSFAGATQQLAASGATGTRTFTETLTQRNYTALTIAFKTAAAGAAADPGVANWIGPAPGLGQPNSLPIPWLGTSDSTDVQANPAEAAAAFIADNPTSAVGGTAAEAVAAVSAANAQAAVTANASSADAAMTSLDAIAATGANVAEAVAAFAALDATVSTSSAVNAAAGLATATLSAADATASVGANADVATASVSAFDATIAVTISAGAATSAFAADPGPPSIGALANVADLAAAANDAASASAALADVGVISFAAPDAVGQSSSPGSASAGAIALAFAAFNAHVHKGTSRPGSGTTDRPGSGTTLRPHSGFTERP